MSTGTEVVMGRCLQNMDMRTCESGINRTRKYSVEFRFHASVHATISLYWIFLLMGFKMEDRTPIEQFSTVVIMSFSRRTFSKAQKLAVLHYLRTATMKIGRAHV